MGEYVITAKLKNVPPIDDLEYALLESAGGDGKPQGDAFVVGVDRQGEQHVLAFIDGSVGAAYSCDRLTKDVRDNPRDAGEEPLVKLVGDINGKTGQVVIKQPEGHWRRYSRWDRLPKGPVTQPDAVVRTLPQCGCGGYLGAPMMFDSFQEMLAYFFVVFSDAESVNAKHAAILMGDNDGNSCCVF